MSGRRDDDLPPIRPPVYPETPGWKARETSLEAAGEIDKRAPTLRDQVLRWFQAGNCGTADDVALAIGESILNTRPRCSELARMGEIVDTGERKRSQHDDGERGRPAIIWKAAR